MIPSSDKIRVRKQNGVNLLEVVVSTFLVTVLLTGALASMAASTRFRMTTSHRAQANLLASELMDEILQHAYVDPEDDSKYGLEESTERNVTRMAFDDVDDYDGWTATPPRRIDGTTLPNMTTWTRTAVIDHVDPDDLTEVLADDDDRGVKRIRVSVFFKKQALAHVDGIQTRAWVDMIPKRGNEDS